MKGLAQRFLGESSLELHELLCAPLAAKLEFAHRAADAVEGSIPPNTYPATFSRRPVRLDPERSPAARPRMG
ncbi:hypothetical protein EVJ58_g8567 [Rhodofomes roseus]|uniref:Uncharacterized protein n=1 Tax=Rhodofomes roseus TaxID=34475 RepID=A0A4Y9XYR0_9APHY|nr:hypothetical protein EVJ58_g8567 [Rhodofomes roseus]